MGDDDSSAYYSNADFKRRLDADPKSFIASLEKKPAKKRKPDGEKGKGGGGGGKDGGKGKSKGSKGEGSKGDGAKGGGKKGSKKGEGDDAGEKKGGKGKGKDKKGGTAEGAKKEKDYRDRAKERREMKGEYETVAAEFENSGEVSLDDSKYLGGDMEHTHLVKGLDYALLRKVRTEMTKQAKAEEIKGERSKRKAVQKERQFATPLAKKVWHAVVETLHPHHSTFRQRLQRMGKAMSMGQRIRGAPSTFLEGRMAYEFDIGSEHGPSDIPRTIYMSKEEAPKVDAKRPASVLLETVNQVKNVLQRVTQERKQRKLDKEKAVSGKQGTYAVAQKVVTRHKAKDMEADIFSGAGGFDTTEFARKAAKEKACESQR